MSYLRKYVLILYGFWDGLMKFYLTFSWLFWLPGGRSPKDRRKEVLGMGVVQVVVMGLLLTAIEGALFGTVGYLIFNIASDKIHHRF